MTFITNEKLAAFADGELDESESAAVRDALASDDLLRARLTRLHSVDDQLRAAFSGVGEDDVPARLARLIDTPAPAVSVYARVGRWLPAGAAIAAGVTGVLIGGMWTAPTSNAWLKPHGAALALAGSAQSAADHTPSGSRYVEGTLTAKPVVSFRAGDGRLCREMQIEGPQVAAVTIVCREAGEWRVEALVRAPAQAQTNGYRPAGATHDPAIAAVQARLQIDSVLDAKSEDDAIAAGWAAK
jgi:anti-sigma factor RsiW